MADKDSFEATYRRHHEALKTANGLNKAAVFDTLADEGIERVTVTFNGEGDSGQIEEVAAHTGEKPAQVPAVGITFYRATWGVDGITAATLALPEAIERLCYDFLSEDHGGWENNDGASGEFSFDVAQRRIELDIDVRYSDSTNYTHAY